MDSFTMFPSEPIVHGVELYTSRFLVKGTISGSFKRVSDLLNRKETSVLRVDSATVSPVGQSVESRRMSAPLLVARRQIHFASPSPHTDGKGGESSSKAADALPREFFIQKAARPCYALTEDYVIFGMVHLLEGATLEQFLETHDTFIPLTRATVYLVTRPNSPWQRDLVIINRDKLEVMYLTEE